MTWISFVALISFCLVTKSRWEPGTLGATFLLFSGLSLAFIIAYVSNTAFVIPVFTHKKLVPREALISWEVGVIWLVIAGLCAASMLGWPILLRGGLLPGGVAIILYLSWRLMLMPRKQAAS